MTTMETSVTTQVYRVYIKATPQAIWDAITTPEWTEKYGYRGRSEYDLRPGGAYRVFATEGMRANGAPDVVVEGEVIESDPPRKFGQLWRMLFDPTMASEPFTRVTWEIVEEMGLSRLTVIHELEGAPTHAALVTGDVPNAGGGWPFILSDLKTLLETGAPLDTHDGPNEG
jgi:uncharacterized protein YndB with AHSA1/START domain